ncbi:MAG TPA: ABC transporter substrate-binding protein [Dehalococcoidia bacterium]|nr:ABC transporter substrate-binding protein [Dehalococcoidia bacterium]
MAGISYWERITKSRISRRRALGAAAAVGAGAAALSVVGCGGGGDGGAGTTKVDPNAILYNWQLPDETKNAREGGTHVGPSSNDIQGGLDPTRSNSFTTLAVAGVAYEPLLYGNSGPGIDPASPEGRKIIGALAESYEVAADASQFTLKMRPNVKFHPIAPVNGRVMDIDDWKVSYERALASPLLGATLKDSIDSVQTPDTRTFVFKMKTPNVAFLRLLTVGSSSFYIVPKEIMQDERRFDTQTIGTNYRVLTSVQPSIGREYVRHVDYWRGKPFIEKWSVPIIPEQANQRAQFVTGNSIAYTPPQTDVLQLRKDYPKARMLKGDPAGSYRINFFGHREFETSPWNDERVRIALRMGVDWKGMREVIGSLSDFAAAGIPVESRMPTHVKAGGVGYPYWLNPEENKLGDLSKNFLFNVAEAKKLLSAAGFPNGFEIDGYMNGGTEYGTTVYPQVVQITIDQWALNLNVRVKLNRPPYAEYLPKIYQQRDFKGISIQHPEFTYAEIDQELFNWYHTRGQRYKWRSDPALDAMIEKQRVERDEEKRTAIIHDIQKHMAKLFYTFPGDGVSGGFGFQQPWYRNTSSPAYREWIDDKNKPEYA